MVVMGKNLVLNIESCGYLVVLFNCIGVKIIVVVEEYLDKNFKVMYIIEEFVELIEKLCWIFLMVKVGLVIDVII